MVEVSVMTPTPTTGMIGPDVEGNVATVIPGKSAPSAKAALENPLSTNAISPHL